MHTIGLGLSWAVLCLGVFDLPVSVPPRPETALLAKIAPEECLFYMSFAGMATPAAGSSNQVEQLFAEDGVQKFTAEIERMTTEGLSKAFERQNVDSPSAEDVVALVKAALMQPAAVYVSDVKIRPAGPLFRGGAVVKLGDNVDEMKTKIEGLIGKLFPDAESVEIGDQKWRQAKPAPAQRSFGASAASIS